MCFKILQGDIVVSSPGHCRTSEGVKPIMGRVEAEGHDDFCEGGGDHGRGEDDMARGEGKKKQGGGGRSRNESNEDLEGGNRAKGGGGEGGNLDHLMGVCRLHGLAPLEDDVGPRGAKDYVTSE